MSLQLSNTSSASGGFVALLPRGETIRNFVYSGMLDQIAKKMPVTIITVVPDEEYLQLIGNGRFHRVLELQTFPERLPVMWLRELLEITHGRRLWSKAAQYRWNNRDREAKTLARKIKRAAKKLLAYPLANHPGVELLAKAECLASRWFRANDFYIELFRELRPSLIFNGSHSHSQNAMQATHSARALGIPLATFLFSWDNLTSQGRIMPPYDYYLAWNEAMRDQLLDIYPSVAPDQVIVTGTPQFDFHFRTEFYRSREEFCAQIGADPLRPIILYSTGMDNHMPGEPLIIEGINEILKGMKIGGKKPQLLVRLYPKDRTPQRFDQVKHRNPDILFPHIPWSPKWQTPKFEDAYLLTNMLRHCDVGINVASTVSLELCMFDKPVINVGYNPPIDIRPKDYALYYEFDHYRPVVESGAVRVARSLEQMRELLTQYLNAPETDRENRRQLIHSMFGKTLHGGISSVIAETLVALASKRNSN